MADHQLGADSALDTQAEVEAFYSLNSRFTERVCAVAAEYAAIHGQQFDPDPATVECWGMDQVRVHWEYDSDCAEFPTSYLWEAGWQDKERARVAEWDRQRRQAKELEEKRTKAARERAQYEVYLDLKAKYEKAGQQQSERGGRP